MAVKGDATRVVIVGLGLIGGSLGAALRAAGGWHVTGLDADGATSATALREGHVDALATGFDSAFERADLIVLATPVMAILTDLERLAQCAPDGATIMDVGSTKRVVHEAMNKLPDRLHAIGGHPMAGRRTAGVSGASAALFRERKMVLVANARTDAVAWGLARRVVADVGAVEIDIEAAAHDNAVAMISHVPHYLSVALLEATAGMDDEQVWKLAAGGFRSATSMAADNVSMWRDIGASNGDCIATALRAVADELQDLASVLEEGDRSRIGTLLETAAARYKQHFG